MVKKQWAIYHANTLEQRGISLLAEDRLTLQTGFQGMEILCSVTFSCWRKATIPRGLKDLLTKTV